MNALIVVPPISAFGRKQTLLGKFALMHKAGKLQRSLF